MFVLTHHPQDAQPAAGVTFLSCDVAEAGRIGLEAADGTCWNAGWSTRWTCTSLRYCWVTGSGCSTTRRGSRPARTAERRGPLSPGERAPPPRHVHLTGQSGELVRAVRAEYASLPGSPINE